MPLNGTKIHPLSRYALAMLLTVARRPTPTQDINPGAVSRLLDEALIEIVPLPSPFQSHKGKPISHAKITEAGRARVADFGYTTHG